MTKKAKRKSIKTGFRAADEPRNTTIPVGCHGSTPHKQKAPNENEADADSDSNTDVIDKRRRLTKGQRRRLQEEQVRLERAAYDLENDTRKVYPADLWFLVGRFVAPECVRVFAEICRDARRVTCTNKFWLQLYARHVTNHQDLPSHLWPSSIGTHVGLKTRVVRSLFFSYPPFTALSQGGLMNSTKTTANDPRDFVVESHWWMKLVSAKSCSVHVWRLFIKFVRKGGNTNKSNRHGYSSSINDTFKTSQHNNIAKSGNTLLHYNPEDGYRILQITTSFFCHVVPHEMFGMCLTQIRLVPSPHDVTTLKVKLNFDEYRPPRLRPRGGSHAAAGNSSSALEFAIYSVCDVRYLDWWHPSYPHPLDR